MVTADNESELAHLAHDLKTSGAPFAVATVVRTVSVTAAKPGAKAIFSADGSVLSGWIGGGCARHSVSAAARKAIEDGQPRLVKLEPEDLLNEQGLVAGENPDGVVIARNMCPSQGTMDIFVEPVLANPELLVLGLSPIAKAVAELGKPCGFSVMTGVAGQVDDQNADLSYAELSDIPVEHSHRYIVVATQGTCDLETIITALGLTSRHLAFVGSQRKIHHLRQKLQDEGFSSSDIERLTGPAGIDIGGVTPQEIGLSILAEIVQIRRAKRVGSEML